MSDPRVNQPRMADNARYASGHVYTATPRNVCDCRHPHDLHYRYGCCGEDCTCAYVPPPMNLVEAVRILSGSNSGPEGWLR